MVKTCIPAGRIVYVQKSTLVMKANYYPLLCATIGLLFSACKKKLRRQ